MDLSGFLGGNKDQFQWLLDPVYGPGSGLKIDLGKNNPDIASMDFYSMKELETYILKLLREHGKKFAYGGYGESREFYKRSPLFLQGEPRIIHLGTDFWLPAFTAIHLPCNGRIRYITDHTGRGNYGPTIITEHHLNRHSFFLLFGHLSRASLDPESRGIMKEQGEIIGYLGDYDENGDWPPHLHFQIIHKLKDDSGDYPGVAAVHESQSYLNNCPDPSLIFNIE
ncbi:MAG: peptidoglycan DD-metalloendopeptidase family protein [Cyclobacteriaceae bacterium]|nr:peptidoglycan DD-metalloendopeptidase family protein [Cyclobacteriaceae bacterium]